ncbi:hypothetical protein H8356DRAFT_1692518 [Neocallimastix lanati (nom. inval.)]|jgi:hypothetical protein|nr:hypothetical protein H8356DRAFT_1692518 [Neocallimastix sp. JGI-2020a]
MTETLCSIYTENPTEATPLYYTENIISSYSIEKITESINNNTLISNINSIISFQNNLKQRNTYSKELPNEILLKIFGNLTDLRDILNLRLCNRKFKSLSEVKLYDIIEEKLNVLENDKKSLEIRLNHMKNKLFKRLSHYKVFLNVISRSDVSEFCNLPNPPREVKYIFSVLYILYTGGSNCQCLQCIENRNNRNEDGLDILSNSFNCGSTTNKKIITRHSFSVCNLTNARSNSPYDSGDESSCSSCSNSCSSSCSRNDSNYSNSSSRRNSFNDFSTINLGNRKNSVSNEETTSKHLNKSKYNYENKLITESQNAAMTPSTILSKHPTHRRKFDKDSLTIEKLVNKEETIEIPDWEEVRQLISKNDFRNWVMNLHSNVDVVPKEHILLADSLLNKPRMTSRTTSSSNDNQSTSEYDNLRLTYDRMLIVSQIGYKILLFIEAIIQSFFLTERYEEQKNSISLVNKQIHQWKELQLQCRN